MRTIVVNIDADPAPDAVGGLGLYARVSSHDRKADLERRVARLSERVAKAGRRVVRVEPEIGSGYGRGSARNRARKALEAARHG